MQIEGVDKAKYGKMDDGRWNTYVIVCAIESLLSVFPTIDMFLC